MPEPSPRELVELLARNELRIRTGILELPVEALGTESDLAVGLGVGYRDICAWKVDRIPAGRTRVGLRWEGITQDLVSLLADSSLPGYCVWVSSLDVLLAGVPFADRQRLWNFMRGTFRQSRGLLLSMPVGATHLLPEGERALWIEYGRLSVWTKCNREW